MPKKKVTIEDLAVTTKRGFDAVDKRFEELGNEVNSRFDAVDKRFVNLEADVSYLKSRVEEIGRTLNHHEEILEEHSVELKWLHKKIDEFTDPKNKNRLVTYQEFKELESRVAAFEKKISSR